MRTGRSFMNGRPDDWHLHRSNSLGVQAPYSNFRCGDYSGAATVPRGDFVILAGQYPKNTGVSDWGTYVLVAQLDAQSRALRRLRRVVGPDWQ